MEQETLNRQIETLQESTDEILLRQVIIQLLQEEDFAPVYEEAERIRRENVGDVVLLRAIIEFSNVCRRNCIYCGLNCHSADLPRYRMTDEEILQAARQAIEAGYGTIVLQSGEDEYYTKEMIGEIIEEIKTLSLPEGAAPAVTLSVGERPFDDYAYWREKGADRYLLKHETADPALYARLHPDWGEDGLAKRIACLKELKRLGYETGSGFMIGLPDQSVETLTEDLLLLREIGCDMAGIGPYIYSPRTQIAEEFGAVAKESGSEEMTRRCVAIARLLLPKANLPMTTALRVIGKGHEISGFGANVRMDKFTPARYRDAYEIYPK